MRTHLEARKRGLAAPVAALLFASSLTPLGGQEPIGSSVVAQPITAKTAPFYPASRAKVTLTPVGVWVDGVVHAPSACDSVDLDVAADGATLQMTLVIRTPPSGCSNPQNPVMLGYHACVAQPDLHFRFLRIRSRVADGPRTPPEVLRNQFEELGRFDLESPEVPRAPFTPFGECGAGSMVPSTSNRVGRQHRF